MKTMTDKQIIGTLKNIQRKCEDNRCDYCEFNLSGKYCGCQIRKLAIELNDLPLEWDIEKIERIIKQ